MPVREPRFIVLSLLVLVAHPCAMGDEPGKAPAAPQSPVSSRPGDANPGPAPGRMFVVGRVLDPQGQPVPGARVVVVARSLLPGRQPPLWRHVPIGDGRADGTGRFRIDTPRTSSALHANLNAVAMSPGYGVGWVELDPDVDQAAADIALPPEQVIQGQLFDVQGRPVADAILSVATIRCERPPARTGARSQFDGVQYGPWANHEFPAWPRPVRTDPEGRFTLAGVGRDLIASLAVRDSRFALQTIDVQTDGAPGSKTVTATLAPSQIVNVRVTDADTGKPVPHAPLLVMASRGQVAKLDESETDAEGRARVNSWATEGTCRIKAYAPAGQPYLTASGRVAWPKGSVEQSLDLALPRGVFIRGKVTEQGTGKPVPGAIVDFVPRGRGQNLPSGEVQVVTAADGSFQLVGKPGAGFLFIKVPGDDYVLEEVGQRMVQQGQPGGQRIRVHGYVALDLAPRVTAAEIAVAVRRGVTVSGQVVGPDGQPVADARIIGRTVLGLGLQVCRIWNCQSPGAVRNSHFGLHGLDPDVETPISFLDPKRKLGATVNFSGKSIALMTIANRTGGVAPGTTIAFPDKATVRGPIAVRLEPCGAATVRLVDPDGEPIAGALPRDVSVTMVVTPGPPSSRIPDPAGRLFAEENDLGEVDPINYRNGLVADAEGRLALPVLIPGAIYRVIDCTGGRDAAPRVRKEFTVKPGEIVDLGDLLIEKPAK